MRVSNATASIAVWALVAGVAVSAQVRAGDSGNDALFDLGMAPLGLTRLELAPALFAQDEGWTVAGDQAVRVDMFIGAIVPQENSGMALGRAAARESFDAGGMFGLRLQAWVADYVRIGGEIDFAAHDVGGGDVLYPGELSRVYLLVPVSFELPFGREDQPFSFGVTVAPGIQVAVPDIDHAIEDFEAFNGRFIDQDAFVGPTLRAAATLRIPINERWRGLVEVQYDWAFGYADVRVRNAIGQTVASRSDDVDLGSWNIFIGASLAF
jgi:hypothetical protein